MDFFLYGVTLAVFVFASVFLYIISDSQKKDKPKHILARNVLPASVIGLLVFIIIKNKDSQILAEKTMDGNFFD